MRKFLAALCLAAVTAVCNVASARADNPALVFDQARARVFVMVSDPATNPETGRPDRYLCTGFYVRPINHGSMIGSAGHCARGGVNYLVLNHTLYRVVWVSYTDDEGYDAAIGVTDAPYPPNLGEAVFNTSQKGDALVEVGFGWGQLQNVVGVDVGPASDVNPQFGDWEVIKGDKPLKPGMSGSPVFNRNGEVVGIHVYGIVTLDEVPTVLGGFTRIDNAFKVWTGDYMPQPQRRHAPPSRIVPASWHLGRMWGQGLYFDTEPAPLPGARACEDAADARDRHLLMYRFICIHVQD